MLKVKVESKYFTGYYDIDNYVTSEDFVKDLRDYDYIDFNDDEIKYIYDMDIKELAEFIESHINEEYKVKVDWD